MKFLRGVLGGLFMCAFLVVDAQIVNVERERIASKDSTGWFGEAGVNFTTSRSTKSYLNFGFNSGIQYKSRRSIILVLTDFSLVNAGNEKFVNNGFAHLRLNTKLNSVIRWEAFTQVQYNSLTKVDVRYIAGTGPRFKLTPYERAKFYWGVAYMYEYEELLDPKVTHRDHRVSTYLSFTLSPEENVKFTSTTYVQPLIKSFSDYRLYNENLLTLAITGNLSLSIKFQVSYDAMPPAGVPNVIYTSTNGLTYEF